MKIKVCGIRRGSDLKSVLAMEVDFVGFIFVPSSPRYIEATLDLEEVEFALKMYPRIRRVGVFVNERAEVVLQTARLYSLTTLQFHGDESPEYCRKFSSEFEVAKAFPIIPTIDFTDCSNYEDCCNFFVFDTAGINRGGNGVCWNWELIRYYQGRTPFLVSGGIGPNEVKKILAIRHDRLLGVDLNSKFEVAPGVKELESLSQFIRSVKIKSDEILSQ